MPACEIQSYATDFADDPQTLAEARLYVSPYDDPDTTLQHMMGAVLTGNSMQALFPDKSISAATEHFLRGVTLAEIGLARTVLIQWDLFGDIPGLTRVLGKSLSDEQQLQFTAAVEQVTARYGEASTDMLLRRLNGELKKNIGADYHIGFEAIRGRLKRAHKILDKALEDSDTIYPLLEPSFPRHRRHSTYELPSHIDGIDNSLTDLGRRISPPDLETIGHLLASKGLHAAAIGHVLQYLTSIRLTPGTSSQASARGKSILENFPPAEAKMLQSLRISRDALKNYGGRRIEDIYENTDEATKLILEVLALPEENFLSKEAQDAAAADIEAGVYAEKKKHEILATCSLGELSETERQLVVDLDTIAATGRAAIRTLLSTHRRLVVAHALKMPRGHVLLDDVVLVGMRGMLRAVRKYNYLHPSNKRFTNYAIPWIRQYMWRYTFRHTWRVSYDTGIDMLRVFTAITRLKVEKAIAGDRREVGNADIAADLNMPLAEVNQLLLLRRNIMSDGAPRYDEERKQRAFDSRPMASDRIQFASHVHEALGQVLTEPAALRILELHIGADLNVQEIAETISLPKDKVSKIITEAVTQLAAHFGQRELFALLRAQDSSNMYDEAPDI